MPPPTPVASVSPVTVTGVADETVAPLPSWPPSLSPQQTTWPVARTAQAWKIPHAAATASLIPATATGVADVSPIALEPQQVTWPVARTAQVWNPAAVIETASPRPV